MDSRAAVGGPGLMHRPRRAVDPCGPRRRAWTSCNIERDRARRSDRPHPNRAGRNGAGIDQQPDAAVAQPLVGILKTDGNVTAIVKFYNLTGQHSTDLGEMLAAAILIVLPVVLVFVAVQRRFIDGMTAGAMKP
jgi:hypothetical protein